MTATVAQIPTPAADALARSKDDLAITVGVLTDAYALELRALKRDALVEKAEARYIDAKRLTKAALVERLSRALAEESGTGKSLSAMQEAARVERAIIAEIEKAPAAVESAKAAVLKAVEKGAWGPESAADAAVAWERSRAALRQWRAVAEVAQESGPTDALVKVARAAASDLISTAGGGSGRSTDAVRNVMRQADVEGTYAFLRVASRHSKDVASLIRY